MIAHLAGNVRCRSSWRIQAWALVHSEERLQRSLDIAVVLPQTQLGVLFIHFEFSCYKRHILSAHLDLPQLLLPAPQTARV